MGRQVTRDEAAEIAGVKADTFSSYVARGQAPAPTRHVGRTPLWDAAKLEKWAADRPGQGSRGTDRARRRSMTRTETGDESSSDSP